MQLIRIILLLFLLSPCIISANNPIALIDQQKGIDKEIVPSPFTLKGEWWQFVDYKHDNLEERIKLLKDNINQAILSTSPVFQENIKSTEQILFRSLDNLLELKHTVKPTQETSLVIKDTYTIEDFISLFDTFHLKKASIDRLNNTIKNEESRSENAEDNISDLLLPYRDASENSNEKLRLGLLLMSNRFQWMVLKASLRSEKQTLDNSLTSLDNTIDEIEAEKSQVAPK